LRSSLDQALIRRWPATAPAETSLDVLPVVLLGDVGQQIAHLQAGDYLNFYGDGIGSHFYPDQFPVNANPHRLKFFATRVVAMSRPPQPGFKVQAAKPQQTRVVVEQRNDAEYEEFLQQPTKFLRICTGEG
jgi:hypothetical protein